MSKPVIAIDIDDVIADSTAALRLAANQIPGVDLTEEHYQVEGEYWDYYETVWATNGVDHLVSFDKLPDKMAVSQSHVKLVQGAESTLKKLSEKYRIVLITSRDVAWVNATKEWIEEKLGAIVSDLIFVHRENSDARTKGDACVELGAGWLIDDNYDHCKSAEVMGVQPLLFGEYGWNRTLPADVKIPRVRNWEAVLEYFDAK